MQNYKKYLNPIVTKLDTIEDFSNQEYPNELFKQEFPQLERVTRGLIADIKRSLKTFADLEEQIEHWINVIDSETGDDKSEAIGEFNKLQSMMYDLIERINRLLEQVDAPYFGKIVFDRKKNRRFPEATIESYLGRFAYTDNKTLLPLITDWRAPIANLYYMNSGPTENVQFLAPTGIQEGDLKQKRQFEISAARISSIHDARSGNAAADEFLLSQLNKRIGQKLKDIVATIQEQQNSIIRADIDKPAVIQGVAGSGKTTILLHRLAYLLYTYAEKIKPEHTLIIAPNRMFLDYISDVLPSLGVTKLEQNIYLFWGRYVLGFNDRFMLSVPEDDQKIMKLKGSEKFVQLIEHYFERYEKELFEGLTGAVGYEIEFRYRELGEQHPEMTMIERLNLSVDYAFAQVQFKKKIVGDFMGSLALEQERRKKILDYIRKNTSVYKIYQNLFKQTDLSTSSDGLSWEKLCKHTNSYLKGSATTSFGYKVEDLAPMIWLHYKIYGYKEYQREYILVDEAQDLSPFQLLTLARAAKKGNLTLAGDLAQSIVPPFHIDNWGDVTDLIEKYIPEYGKHEYHELFRCYRTTVEVIEFANQIFRKYFPDSYRLPEAVLRHGEDVRTIELPKRIEDGDKGVTEQIISLVNGEIAKGASTTAIICRNEGHADRVHQVLSNHIERIEALLVSHKEEDYHTGVLVLPVEKAKGLEFDSVILADVSDEYYKDNGSDVRLLYVAITRALHRLLITKPLGKGSTLLDI